ncbi:MAG: lipoate--protein ligase family protein [Acidobacteria bacterium]|nr:lipoate--protein ligase family protein [Acidobacteriota bacterium]
MCPRSNRNVIRLLDLGLTESWRTQALYHAIAATMRIDSPDTILLCRPREPYLCLGYHQAYDATLERQECERRGLAVFRRRLGGGATYLDVNQIFYQCIAHHTRMPVVSRDIYKNVLGAPTKTLRRLGLNAELWDANEIEVAGKRIAGTGGGRIGEACVVVGNLLFDFDYDMLAQLWRVPWESFRELAHDALPESITTLKQSIGPLPVGVVQEILAEEFANAFGRPVVRGDVTVSEEQYARELATRMTSSEYLNLHGADTVGPAKSLKISARVWVQAEEVKVDGHQIRASFRVREHVIEEARLESRPARIWRGVEVALRGVPFNTWQRKLLQQRIH